MRTLKRYIGREVLLATLLIFAALLMLFAFFDLIHELGDVGRGGYTMTAALLYVALHLPGRLYELFPVAALIGTLFAIAQLVANSEYTVMRASGMSLVQLGWAVLRVGIPLAAATFSRRRIRRPACRATRANGARVFARRHVAHHVATVPIGVLVQGGPDVRQHPQCPREHDAARGQDLRVRSRSPLDRDTRRRIGRFIGDGKWQLENVKTTELGADGTKVSTKPSLVWQTVLRPSILNVYQVAPERLDLNALYDNIRLLTNNAQKTSRFEIAFWNKVFYPAAVLVMMVLALPFAHFQRRQGGIGFRIFAGTMLGLTFFLLGRLFSNLGLLNDWPALFSAAFPLVVFVTVAGGMLWWIERR
jgi:lipopolysaccharide export system permease protein